MASSSVVSSAAIKDKLFAEVFPQIDGTERQSAAFAKRLLSLCISNLMYTRGICSNDSYIEKDMHGFKVRMINETHDGPIKQISNLLKGCFEAIDRNYARVISFEIYTKEEHNLVEAYFFKFSYSDHGDVLFTDINDQSIPSTVENVKEHTFRILNTIIMLTRMMKALPTAISIEMKILYYDDITPHDYEPFAFRPSKTELNDAEDCMTFKFGDAKCTHHALGMRGRTEMTFLANGSAPGIHVDTAKDSKNRGDKAVDGHGDERASNAGIATKLINKAVLQNNMDMVANRKGSNLVNKSAPVLQEKPQNMKSNGAAASKHADLFEEMLQCDCVSTGKHGMPLVKCTKCSLWQSTGCLGIEKIGDDDKHINMYFSKPGDQGGSALEITKIEVKPVNVLGRSCLMCTYTKMENATGFAKMSVTERNAKLLLHDIVTNGLLVKKPNGHLYEVKVNQPQSAPQKPDQGEHEGNPQHSLTAIQKEHQALLKKLKLPKKTSPGPLDKSVQEALDIQKLD